VFAFEHDMQNKCNDIL